VACTLDGGGDAALELEAVACDAAREQLALFVDELEQEVGIFVINVLDAESTETAVFFATQTEFRIAEELYIFSGSSHCVWALRVLNKWVIAERKVLSVEVHDLWAWCDLFAAFSGRSRCFFLFGADAAIALVVVVLDTVFVEFDGQEAE
jgi:hypothetical protein